MLNTNLDKPRTKQNRRNANGVYEDELLMFRRVFASVRTEVMLVKIGNYYICVAGYQIPCGYRTMSELVSLLPSLFRDGRHPLGNTQSFTFGRAVTPAKAKAMAYERAVDTNQPILVG